MNTAPLSDLAEINPRAPHIADDDEVNFVGMSDLSAEHARTESSSIRPYGEVKKGYTVFRDGDILVAKITPCFENNKIGHAHLVRKFGVGSTEFHVIRPSDEINDRYLKYFLRQGHIRKQGEMRMTGSAGQRRVPVAYLKSLEVPLPAMAEQIRIAAILDKADSILTHQRGILSAFDALSSSIFLTMFGDPVSNPKSWPMNTLGDKIDSMQYGPRFYNESYSPEGIRIVRITDLDQHGILDFDGMPRMDVNANDLSKFALSQGDIVFARTGATVGKLALIGADDPPCIAGAYFIRIRSGEEIESQYLAALLRTSSIQSIISSGSHQSAQQNFSGPGLRSLPLPCPPIELQRRFSAAIHAMHRRRSDVAERTSQLDILFASLQARAFRGEL